MTDTSLWPQFLVPFERELYVLGALGGILGLMISVCSIAIALRALRARVEGDPQPIRKASEANLQLVVAIWGVSFGCSVVFFAGLIAAAIAGFFPEESQRQIPVILITCVAVFVSMFAAIGSMILWPERFPFRTAAVSIIIMLFFAGFTAATITPGNPPLLNSLDLAEMIIPTSIAIVIFVGGQKNLVMSLVEVRHPIGGGMSSYNQSNGKCFRHLAKGLETQGTRTPEGFVCL